MTTTATRGATQRVAPSPAPSFPVVKRVNESLALGFVVSRMVEAAIIMTGVVALLAVVTLRQDFAGSAAADVSALTTGRTPQSAEQLSGQVGVLGAGAVSGRGRAPRVGFQFSESFPAVPECPGRP